jgi:hypothetical protein
MITYKYYKCPLEKKNMSINKYVNGVQVISIPLNEENSDYQKFLKWVAEGNEPLPADE